MKNLVVLDFEVYPNYTLFAFQNIDNGKKLSIEIIGENNCLSKNEIEKLQNIMSNRTTFGFNSINYDLPILLFALMKKTAKEICNLSNYIIDNNSNFWQTCQKFNLNKPTNWKHFDIKEIAQGVGVSLKLYGARLNTLKLQDLPIEANTMLTKEEIDITRKYCFNDLQVTIDLYNKILPQIRLREDMSSTYNIDLLSKSDAQIAEAVIKSELKKINVGAKKPILLNKTFKYILPHFLKFKTENLKNVLDTILNCEFELDDKGSIILPKILSEKRIKIGQSEYQLGIGGLHSTEKSQAIIPNSTQLLIDKDVASYYPNIILNQKLYPKHLTSAFLEVYKKIVNDRLEAKRKGDKVVNEALKIVINGSFGKFGNKYSILYSPDLLLQVTLTGQLSLLMLIEELELNDISVVSANTDGILALFAKDDYGLYNTICFDWSLKTNLFLEETRYSALYSRDVNNYLALKPDGSHKGKGIFAEDGISKNQQAPIIYEAIIDLIKNGTSIEKTIKCCTDITKFLYVRRVKGGAFYGGTFVDKDKKNNIPSHWLEQGTYIGKVVRYVNTTNGSIIRSAKPIKSGAYPLVAGADKCLPVIDLSCDFPDDIDYQRYIKDAKEILKDINYNL